MKTFGGFRSGDEFFYGELRGDEVHRLSEPYWIQVQPTGEILPLANLQIDVPVAPSKLIAVGLNYADHIAEMKRTEIGAPLIWFKAPSSLLVIGSRTKNVSADNALDHVFGYTIGLDITDRDLQKQEKQFGRCKSFDSYTPIGPFVYADADVRDASIKLWQNGELRQSTRTSRMIHSVAQIISFVSQSLTLFPGDVILTGTPAGVGPIQAGDELEAEVDDWPRLRNTVAIAQDSPTRQR